MKPNSRAKVFLTLTILGVGIGLLLPLLSSPEPQYQGRPITSWLDEWATKRENNAQQAIEHTGNDVMPYVISSLVLNDSNWRSNYIRLQAKLPRVMQRFFKEPKPLLQEVDGANVFFILGTNSLPEAIRLLKHKSPTVRRSAAWGIGAVCRKSGTAKQAIPPLIQALADKDRMVRFYAAISFQEMGSNAATAVPALARVVADRGVGAETNQFFYLRAAAACALGKIGPAASNALPFLRAALQEPNSYLRGQVAVAIWRIDSDVDAAMPVLLREMPSTSDSSKWDWIVALGEMGPRARAAVPQLRNELKNDQKRSLLEYVTNALKRIEPELPPTGGAQ